MRVSCLEENLAGGLAIVGRAVASRTTLPVLSNIMLATDMGRLKLAATNLEMGISCWVGAKVEEDGATTVPARVLIDLVNALPPERIDMELTVRTQTLNLRCARFEANIKGIDAQEFPLIPVFQEDEGLKLEVDVLGQMIEQVAFAAATDESRPILTGVLMHFGPASGQAQGTNWITMAAADGFRLSVRREPFREREGQTSASSVEPTSKQTSEPWSVIVPARTLSELARITRAGEVRPGQEKLVALSITSERNQILFHQENGHGYSIDLVSQLIEGNFPDYTQIIPTNYTIRTVAETEALLKAVRMANIFARDAANVIRLSIVPGSELTPGHMTVAATSAELGDHVGEIDVDVEEAGSQTSVSSVEPTGEPMNVAFNANYLIDILSRIGTAQVALETTGPSSPAVIRPVGGPDLTHVIMPVHISG